MDSRIERTSSIPRNAWVAVGLIGAATYVLLGMGRSSDGGTGVRPQPSVDSRTLAPGTLAADIPMPNDFRIVGPGVSEGTALDPTTALGRARLEYPSAVGPKPVVRFLTIVQTDRGSTASARLMWAVVSAGVSFPVLGDVQTNASNSPQFSVTYGWVFLDGAGTSIGASFLGYRDEAAPLLPNA